MKPGIVSFDITIFEKGEIGDIHGLAQYDVDDSIEFEVVTNSNIWNEDGTLGEVVIEDISELGGDELPYDDEYELDHKNGNNGSDNIFSEQVDVEKKNSFPNERSITFSAKATNQAVSIYMVSETIDIFN